MDDGIVDSYLGRTNRTGSNLLVSQLSYEIRVNQAILIRCLRNTDSKILIIGRVAKDIELLALQFDGALIACHSKYRDFLIEGHGILGDFHLTIYLTTFIIVRAIRSLTDSQLEVIDCLVAKSRSPCSIVLTSDYALPRLHIRRTIPPQEIIRSLRIQIESHLATNILVTIDISSEQVGMDILESWKNWLHCLNQILVCLRNASTLGSNHIL